MCKDVVSTEFIKACKLGLMRFFENRLGIIFKKAVLATFSISS